MKISIDTQTGVVTTETEDQTNQIELYSREAFELLSKIWLKVGWNEKYSYTFSWLGRPVIQNPEDLIRAQEVIYRLKPDVIIETGIAHGGSLIYYASLCKALGKGRVVGIDVEIRPENRRAIEDHDLHDYITLLNGSSIDPAILQQVQSLIQQDERVLIFLDSNHTKSHVLAELEAYHNLVTPGSYIVATDGLMKDLHDVPKGKPEWLTDNPMDAALDFAHAHPEFILEQPEWIFNESGLQANITYWPCAWLRRVE